MDNRFARNFSRFNFVLLLVAVFAVLRSPSSSIAQTYSNPTILHTFNGTDGQYPNPGLTIDSNGTLYGVTAQGGPDFNPGGNPGNFGYGTIFKFSGGVLTTLGSFDGASGKTPIGRVTIDSLGNLWGVTY